MLTQDDLCEFFVGTLESFAKMASVFPPLATILMAILENLKKVCYISQLALKEEQKNPEKFKELQKEIEVCFGSLVSSVRFSNKLIAESDA